MSASALDKLIREYRIFHCLECGKCTGACPLAQSDKPLSPRLLAREAIENGLSSESLREGAWGCLTCGLCLERCPSGIDFAGFLTALRPLLKNLEIQGHISHGGALQTLMRLQARPGLEQNRLDWLDPELETAEQGEVLLFTGCLPYFDVFFSYLDVDLTGMANSAIKIINRLGITPALLPGERCCGHDLYYGGEREDFERLRELNLDSFAQAGAETIVTVCPECAHTLGGLYQKDGQGSFKVQHLTQYLSEKIGAGHDLDLERSGLVGTFQDPCRLSRYLQITDEPRRLLEKVLDLREMAHSGKGAWCCGNSAWIGCGRYAKSIQQERFREALEAGAGVLATACPKCLIHLSCAQADLSGEPAGDLEIKDIVTLIAASLRDSGGEE